MHRQREPGEPTRRPTCDDDEGEGERSQASPRTSRRVDEVPIATKKTRRIGPGREQPPARPRRPRAVGDGEPADERRERERDPEQGGPGAGQVRPGRDRHDRKRSCSSRSRSRTCGRRRATATARSAEQADPSERLPASGRPAPIAASRTTAITTPATSWRTPQPSSAVPSAGSVVRRRLRVMLTMTTRGRHRDRQADERRRAAARARAPAKAPAEIAVVTTIWRGAAQMSAPWSRRSRPRSTSMPTSNRRRTTPTSASRTSWCRSAT